MFGSQARCFIIFQYTVNEGDRAFNGLEDITCTDVVTWLGKLVAATRSLDSNQQLGLCQLPKDLGDVIR